LIWIKVSRALCGYDQAKMTLCRAQDGQVIGVEWIPQIDRQRCTGCGECVARCPTGALGWDRGKAAVLHPDSCTYMAICEAVCPASAIELPYVICTADYAASATRAYLMRGLMVMNPYVYFPNLIESVPDIPPDSIVSRTLHADDEVKAVLFGFAQGQELSEHTASMPATILILQGEAALTLGSDRLEAHPGTWVHMPPNMPHSLLAETPVVMLLLLFRAGYVKEAQA
jgi:quercetin dioxygenase-like cupin family protein/NAD-dependent dihydropyrimidine dehydrogenase PreA subunit